MEMISSFVDKYRALDYRPYQTPDRVMDTNLLFDKLLIG
jgi:hypothetical protein